MSTLDIPPFCLAIGRALIEMGLPVRVSAYMSPSGCYWRCNISYQSHTLYYSTGGGWNIFELGDCSTMTPMQAAKMLVEQGKFGPIQTRPLWDGSIQDAETILWVDWFCRMVDMLAPKGAWSEFSDYGGFTLMDPEGKLSGKQWPEWEGVLSFWKGSKQPHPFLKYPERHTLADTAKTGNWHKVKEILAEFPTWVNMPRPVLGQTSSGYTPLHQAAYLGSYEAAKMLIDLGADLSRSSRDGTPLQIARVRGHTQLAEFFESTASSKN